MFHWKRKLKWQGAKYNSKSIERFWIEFKSMKELEFYIFCKWLKSEWKIDDFSHESEKFTLVDTIKYNWTTYKKTTYTPDFKVTKGSMIIYVDTKSEITAKKESFRVKIKIFLEKYIIWKEDISFIQVIQFNEFTDYLGKL